MKHFFALPAVLRASLLLASASQHGFSVNDDLLAFPQFRVSFSDGAHTEEEAAEILHAEQHFLTTTSDSNREIEIRLNRGDGEPPKDSVPLVYEQMIMDGTPFLCSIPQVEPVVNANNGSAGANDTLSRAEEEKELARATDRGWELLSGMQGNCVYFISGWWSYRFCYGEGVKQFHQLPPSAGLPMHPPMEDPGVPGFELGIYRKNGQENIEEEDDDDDEDTQEKGVSVTDKKKKSSWNGELVQSGETRYLVQRLGGGTICDLTRKPRSIEVQFHCNPQAADRISHIKETATCAYLMVIQTPRLCNDVAFQPPQKDDPNTISCTPVLPEDEIEQYKRDMSSLQSAERTAKIWRENANAASIFGIDLGPNNPEDDEQIVGDVVVGGRTLVPEGKKIEKGTLVGGGKETYLATLASSDGKTFTEEDVKKYNLGDAKQMRKWQETLEKAAKDKEWRLDVVDTPRGRELRALIGNPEEAEDQGKEQKEEKGEQGPEGEKNKPSVKKDIGSNGNTGKKAKRPKKKEGAGDQGSEEEYYKEEL